MRPPRASQARLSNLYTGWLAFRGNHLAMVGLLILVALVLIAAFAPLLAPARPVSCRTSATGCSRWAPRGTSSAPTRWGATSSRASSTARASRSTSSRWWPLIAPLVGLLVGTVAGYVGGWLDAVLMRITDIFLAFPRLVLALAFVAALGAGIENAVIAISLTAWPPYARIARAETLTMRNQDFISAIRLQGAGPMRIITRPHLAAVHLLAHRARHARHGGHHPGGGGARLPRPRRATAQRRSGAR